MSQTLGQQANSLSGKPMNVGDQVTIVGSITAISGYGPTATISVKAFNSGNSLSVQANDCGASTETV